MERRAVACVAVGKNRTLCGFYDLAQAAGLRAVLGDGLGAEINCWMEARVADGLLDNAGEFNGFIKIRPEARLLADPLQFAAGEVIIPADWWPEMDRARLKERTIARERFAPTTA